MSVLFQKGTEKIALTSSTLKDLITIFDFCEKNALYIDQHGIQSFVLQGTRLAMASPWQLRHGNVLRN